VRRLLIVCAAAFLFAPLAVAREPEGDRLAEAEKLAKAGQHAEAARIFGAELAGAQKKKDLARQEQTVRSLLVAMRTLGGGPAGGGGDYARSLEIVMLALDPKQNFAFCSAGQIGHALLMDATLSGDFAHVPAAAKVCAEHAKISKVGPFAGAMADYAAGLLDVANGEPANGIPRLQASLDLTAREGWAWPSVHVATELAAACVAAHQDDMAAAALSKAADVLKASGDRTIAQRFRKLVDARLKGASEKVLRPCEDAMKPFSGGGSAGAAGGRGGGGGSADDDLSKVGKAWKKLSAKKPVVAVTRTDDGYVVRQAFDKKFEARQAEQNGVKHQDDGGITLSFWDGGTRLHMVDLEGRQGQPGESSEPGPFLFFHPLARGYTWGVAKSGIVTETKAK